MSSAPAPESTPPEPQSWTGALNAHKWTAAYVALIPFINWSFTWAPNLPIAPGLVFNPVTVVTGLVLVVRDFSQREIGHKVLLAMVVALALSVALAGPEIALASGLAFAISELADWAVYTFTKRPLHERILYSSLVGAPIDSAVFLYGASQIVDGALSWPNLIMSIAGKLAGAAVVAELVRRRLQYLSRSADTA